MSNGACIGSGGVADSGTESAFTNIAGGSSAALTSNNTNTNPTVLDSPTLTGFTTSDPIQISFDFDITTANIANNDTFILNSSRNIILNFGSAPISGTNPGAMIYKDGSSAVTSTFTASLNTWYRITLGLSAENATSPTWSINVANTSGSSLYSASGISFTNTLAPYSSFNYSFNTAANNGGGAFNIDNVLVQSPEPASLLLFGTAGASILLLPRSKRNRA
ncbi:MAG: hypothetical protein ACP5O7_03355 [Phycisphaerae bacterium]